MKRVHIGLLAAVLALLVVLGIAAGMRCLSVSTARCSIAGFLGQEQPRLDVPYAGTRPEVIDAMLEIARVGPDDYVIDLGTGDGRILIAAARDRGARGLGVDIDPVLVREAEAAARQSGVGDRVAFRVEDLFETPLADASVLAMFLLPEVNLKLRPRILAELAPGARVVSHAFDMGDWRPDATGRAGGARVYLWVVPARIDGRWRLADEAGEVAVLDLDQSYQTFGGTVSSDGVTRPVLEGRLMGERIRFVADTVARPRLYEGVVRGGVIEPVGPDRGWRATRVE